MTITAFNPRQTAAPAPVALVIEPNLSRLLFVLSSLSATGFDATVADSFKDAKAALLKSRPDLLVAGVKLRDYNGLHLVLRGHMAWNRVPSILTAEAEDAVLQQEAEQLGSTWVILPTTVEEFAAAIARTIFEHQSAPAAGPLRPPFERRRSSRRSNPKGHVVPERRLAERRKALRESVLGLAL